MIYRLCKLLAIWLLYAILLAKYVLSKYIYDYERGLFIAIRCFKYLLYSKGKHFQLGSIICPKYFLPSWFLLFQPTEVDKDRPSEE